MKNYIGISRDHSISMRSIARAAARDFNSNIEAIKTNSEKQNQDTIVSVVKCGVGFGGSIVRESVNSTVAKLQPIAESQYVTDGNSTPLFDSVGDLIEILESVPDAKDPTVSFLVMAVTDGQDNSSRRYSGYSLSRKIQQLQSTDRWTFVFRVPRGYRSSLISLGIPEGNVLEWDQTERGVEVATQATTRAFEDYYVARSAGKTSTKSFYTTDLSKVSARSVRSKLIDISDDVEVLDVTQKDNGAQIRAFVEKKIGKPMMKGAAFYQLTKKEDEIQDYKQIAIRDKKSKAVYSGAEARQMLGLPYNGTVKVVPGNHGTYDIFIQSTSVNRKLVAGTQILYWENVGTAFQS